LRERGYFDPQTVARILSEHRNGVRDHARHLWGLLTFELWQQQFIDRLPVMSFNGSKSMNVLDMKAAAAAFKD
jgi:hypothetical protein